MLKYAFKVKFELQTVSQVYDAAHRALGRVPFFRILRVAKGGRLSDAVLELSDGERSWSILADFLVRPEPKFLREKAARLKEEASLRGSDWQVLLVGEYFSNEAAAICRELDVSYADVAGNCYLHFGKVFVQVEGRPNPSPSKRGLKSLFASSAQRVLRVLLTDSKKAWKVTDLSQAADVSWGTVSNVRRKLIDQEWAEDAQEGLRVTKPEVLLDEWAKVDRWEKRTEVRQYSLLATDPKEIALEASWFLKKGEHAFTQWFAGWLRHPYTVPPVVSVYVKDFPDETELEKHSGARRVTDGGRLWLVKPKDEGVFWPSQTVGGFTLVSDVQIYLDLLRAGLRGDEQAKQLRAAKDFGIGKE